MVSIEDYLILERNELIQNGIIYLAKTKTNKKVIIKQIDKTKSSELFFLKKCKDIENISQIDDSFENENSIFMVFDKKPNQIDVWELIKVYHELTEEVAFFIFREVVKAVKKMFEMNIVHRDIKQENVVVVIEDLKKKLTIENIKYVQLIDFGNANFVGMVFDEFQPTMVYSPPELHLKNEVHENFDVWSLGVFLFSLLKGDVPFEEDFCLKNKRVFLSQFTQQNVDRLLDLFEDGKAKEMLKKILIVSPEDRMSMSEFFKYCDE